MFVPSNSWSSGLSVQKLLVGVSVAWSAADKIIFSQSFPLLPLWTAPTLEESSKFI